MHDAALRLLTIRASAIKGRRLISADPSGVLPGGFRIEVPEFRIRETDGVPKLRTDPEAIARRIIRENYELLNWNDPDEKMLQSWQQKLLQRQF